MVTGIVRGMASDEGSTTRRAEYAEETRAALVNAAREVFTEKGYAGASTEQILRRARASRGAMYHHFAGKADLFRAALEAVEEEFIGRLAEGGAPGSDVWDEICNGCQLFLDIATEPQIQRLMLTEGPAVLGWRQWREIEERYGFGLLRGYLNEALTQGLIAPQSVDALTNVLAGALNEAAMHIAHAEDRVKARAEVGASISRLLDGLRVRPARRLRAIR
jgi:AcrR family transcriptional regulator